VQCPLQFWPIFNETEPHFLVDLCRRWNAKTISGFGSVLDWTQTEVGSYLLDASVAESRTPFMSAGKMDAPPLKGRGGLGAKFEFTLGEVPTRHQSQPLSAPIAFLYFIFRQTLHFSSNLWRAVDLFAASDPSSLFLFQFVTARDFSVVLWVRVPNTLEVNSRLTKHLQIVRSKPHSSVIITVISVTNLVDCWKLSRLIITRIGSVM
jgi:hypothetical protein